MDRSISAYPGNQAAPHAPGQPAGLHAMLDLPRPGDAPACTGLAVLLTGMPCSGKTSLALRASSLLRARGLGNVVVDGDVLRAGLCRDLGFSAADRLENHRRAGHVMRLVFDAGLVAITAMIAPTEATRQVVASLFDPRDFFLVRVSCCLEECVRRDVKGHYKRALAGSLENFTGISSPYDPPAQADLTIDTDRQGLEEASLGLAQAIAQVLEARATRQLSLAR